MASRTVSPLRWSTIVVATDFSECADDALLVAARVALAHKAKLVLVHSAELPAGLGATTRLHPAGAAMAVTVEEYVASEAMSRLAEQRDRVLPDNLEVETRVTLGTPADRIVATAKDVGADLVVLGTHGRTGLAHVILGSVAERVVRMCPVPVLTIRHPEGHRGEGKTTAERALDDEDYG